MYSSFCFVIVDVSEKRSGGASWIILCDIVGLFRIRDEIDLLVLVADVWPCFRFLNSVSAVVYFCTSRGTLQQTMDERRAKRERERNERRRDSPPRSDNNRDRERRRDDDHRDDSRRDDSRRDDGRRDGSRRDDGRRDDSRRDDGRRDDSRYEDNRREERRERGRDRSRERQRNDRDDGREPRRRFVSYSFLLWTSMFVVSSV